MNLRRPCPKAGDPSMTDVIRRCFEAVHTGGMRFPYKSPADWFILLLFTGVGFAFIVAGA